MSVCWSTSTNRDDDNFSLICLRLQWSVCSRPHAHPFANISGHEHWYTTTQRCVTVQSFSLNNIYMRQLRVYIQFLLLTRRTEVCTSAHIHRSNDSGRTHSYFIVDTPNEYTMRARTGTQTRMSTTKRNSKNITKTNTHSTKVLRE